MDSAAAHYLEGDGVISNLLFFLWKHKTSMQCHPLVADLCVASTVIFEHNFPKAWYYNTEGDVRDLERKLGRDVDTHSILHEFCPAEGGLRGAPPLPPALLSGTSPLAPSMSSLATGSTAPPLSARDIVATYYATVDLDTPKPSTRVEFLDAAGLEDLLLRRTRRPDGMLQRWVTTASKCNTVLQAVWSPHLCVVHKRQANASLRDRRKSLFERAVTYEGPTHLSSEVLIAPHVQRRVSTTCAAMVHQLYESNRIAVQRMVLHFKVDADNGLWLLYCSSIRVTSRRSVNLVPRFQFDPSYVRHAHDEPSPEQQTTEEMARKLKNEALEASPSRTTPRSRGSPPRTPTTQTHPLHDFRPKPPTMGPIGDTFDVTTTFAIRADQLRRMKEAGALGNRSSPSSSSPRPSTGAPTPRTPRPPVPRLSKAAQEQFKSPSPRHPKERSALSSPSGGGGALTPPALGGPTIHSQSFVVSVPRSVRRRRTLAASAAASLRGRPRPMDDSTGDPHGEAADFSALAQRLADITASASTRRATATAVRATRTEAEERAIAEATLRAQSRWQVVRLAVRSGAVVSAARYAEAKEWCNTLLYVIYSHFAYARTPLTVRVPAKVLAVLPNDWIQRIGVTATVSPPHRCRPSDDVEPSTMQAAFPPVGASAENDQPLVEMCTVSVLAVGVPLLRLQSAMASLIASAIDVPMQRELGVYPTMLATSRSFRAGKAASLRGSKRRW